MLRGEGRADATAFPGLTSSNLLSCTYYVKLEAGVRRSNEVRYAAGAAGVVYDCWDIDGIQQAGGEQHPLDV